MSAPFQFVSLPLFIQRDRPAIPFDEIGSYGKIYGQRGIFISVIVHHRTAISRCAPTGPKGMVKTGGDYPLPAGFVGEVFILSEEGIGHLRPALETVFAGDDEQGARQGEIGLFDRFWREATQARMRGFDALAGIILPGMVRVQELLGLIFEAFETGFGGKLLGRHTILLCAFA